MSQVVVPNDAKVEELKAKIVLKINILKERQTTDRDTAFTQSGQLEKLKAAYTKYKTEYDATKNKIDDLNTQIKTLGETKERHDTEVTELKAQLEAAGTDKQAIEDFGNDILNELKKLDGADEELDKEFSKRLEDEKAKRKDNWFWGKELTESDKKAMNIQLLSRKITETEDVGRKQKFVDELAKLKGESSNNNEEFIKQVESDLSKLTPPVEGKEGKEGNDGEEVYTFIEEGDGKKGGRGKGRKTKRSMSMGGNTKKRSKGGKRRTSKK